MAAELSAPRRQSRCSQFQRAAAARLFPRMLDFHVKLAALHEQAGHSADAVHEYEAVIEGIRREGKSPPRRRPLPSAAT